ncbi:hypothetical protein [Pseudophaeobacter leonis]|uniref:hypothetical protein n=1 Tax=Pseudophaeobacter leonis TaxID=1144477 RepID=UPI0009F59600|nr:hypothetical protein [Pseudophaeobacter leonis]
MAKLKETQLDLIKRYVSHPSGMGYVADFSNQTFSTWFRDTWNVDIDDPKYEIDGTSKGNRLIAFCRQSDETAVYRVLNSLRQMAHDLEIEKSEIVKIKDVKAFDKLLEIIEQNIPKNTQDEVLEELVLKNVTRRQLLSKAKSNEVSLLLVGATALENLSAFREVVRSDNLCAVETPEIHSKLLELIDALIEHIEKLLNILPSASVSTTDKDGDEIVSWTQRYVNGALPKLQEYFAPERLGTTSVPVGVILACGGLGSLLTGFNLIGFGAGSVVGKLIVGEMKSGAAADQITKRLDVDE